MNFADIVRQLGDGVADTWTPDDDLDIQGVAAVETAEPGTISLLDGDRVTAYWDSTQASALIVGKRPELQALLSQRGVAWIAAADPRWAFARAIALFYQPFRPPAGIHPTAAIDPTAKLGRDVSVGAHAVLEAGVELGDGVCVGANVVLYPDVSVGDRSFLHANCTIHERVCIGADCTIQSGAVVGAEGFGFVATPSGAQRMEQSGRVVLEDGVELGCNSTVDRPAVGETRIGRNTKLDNLVQVGHGCRIGANCLICAQVGLAGGVVLGDGITLAGQVGVANRARIGDGAIASAKTGIHRDVEAGAVVSGFPAIENRLWRRTAALYKRLPELYQMLRQIQQRLDGNGAPDAPPSASGEGDR